MCALQLIIRELVSNHYVFSSAGSITLIPKYTHPPSVAIYQLQSWRYAIAYLFRKMKHLLDVDWSTISKSRNFYNQSDYLTMTTLLG